MAVGTVVGEDSMHRKPYENRREKAECAIVKNPREKSKARPVGRKRVLTAQVESLREEKTIKWSLVNVWREI